MASVLDKIECPEFLKFDRERQVLAEIRKWENFFTAIKFVLDNAEEKQMEDRLVESWLSDLKNLAYDVEDILDEFAPELLQRRLKGNVKPVQITTIFQEIAKQQQDLGFIKKNVGSTSSCKVCTRPPSTCLHHEPEVYGRDEDKRKLLDLLLRDETSDVKVGVIPIVGMGGVGKTTLARLVYNDKASQQQFQVKSWVSVSDEFDILRITKSILQSTTLKSCDLKELNQIQLKLHEKLAGRKFFIVLDDVLEQEL
ncbi:hypothetical protein GH714_004185 [Hevea brasiliensis]|uniref:NB-ARC domain-containing protein n=1 Tax=Hevea brasiliensis TaxID=3981 RepID=A0A6A6KXD6_HEVBR|nr:hypothetical protein GH714_004185 [Hevea brasiliensis]